MLPLLFALTLSTAHADESAPEYVASATLYLSVAHMGQINFRNGDNLMEKHRYTYGGPGGYPSLAASIGGENVGAMAQIEVDGYRNSDGEGFIYGYATLGPVIHVEKFDFRIGFGYPINVDELTEYAEDDGFVVNIGVDWRFFECERFSTAFGVQAHSWTTEYPFDYSIEESALSALVSITTRKD